MSTARTKRLARPVADACAWTWLTSAAEQVRRVLAIDAGTMRDPVVRRRLESIVETIDELIAYLRGKGRRPQ